MEVIDFQRARYERILREEQEQKIHDQDFDAALIALEAQIVVDKMAVKAAVWVRLGSEYSEQEREAAANHAAALIDMGLSDWDAENAACKVAEQWKAIFEG